MSRFLAFLVAGCILGAAGATIRLGAGIDRLVLDNVKLIDEVERLTGELASRERMLTRGRLLPVRSVEVQVENVATEHTRLHIEAEVHELLEHLVGEEVSEINPGLIEGTLRRSVRVDGQDFTVRPTLIVLGSRIVVRLWATEGSLEIVD